MRRHRIQLSLSFLLLVGINLVRHAQLKFDALVPATHNNTTLSQSGWTALIGAAGSGHVNCVPLLLDAGADAGAQDEVC